MFKIYEKNSESIAILNENEKSFTNYGTTNHLENNNLPYPRAVIFVLCSKFFESFSANGVRTILALYLRDSLNFSEDEATSTLHIFNFFGQFCPILGAVVADSYIGNVRAIIYFFILYFTGWCGMIIMTFPHTSVLPVVSLVFLSLILISIGNGSIRACITSLGASQFKLPDQNILLDRYFSHYYFVYTLGILLSKIVPPSIRAETKCFGNTDCYSAVFGTLGTMFLSSWLVFLFGCKFYKKEEDGTGGNILGQVIKCIWYGIIKKIKGETNKNAIWIKGAVGRFTESFVDDVTAFLKVLKLFIPLPIYWSLLAQQDSSWTFQATQLNTNIFGLAIEADQAKAAGPILLLILIPCWKKFILPGLNRIGITVTPLKSVALGGIFATISFLCSGILQICIENQTDKNTINILWQIPQFFLLMMGEVLLSIPGLQFCFTQAPNSMKSVLTAAWFINNAFGNLIVVFLTELLPLKKQSHEYFMYSILMFIGILLFMCLAANSDFTRSQNINSFDVNDNNINNHNHQSTNVIDDNNNININNNVSIECNLNDTIVSVK